MLKLYCPESLRKYLGMRVWFKITSDIWRAEHEIIIISTYSEKCFKNVCQIMHISTALTSMFLFSDLFLGQFRHSTIVLEETSFFNITKKGRWRLSAKYTS
jgi:hypothetical protein